MAVTISPEFVKMLNNILEDKPMETCCKNCANFNSEKNTSQWSCLLRENSSYVNCMLNPLQTVCTAFKKKETCYGCYYTAYSGLEENYCSLGDCHHDNTRCREYIQASPHRKEQDRKIRHQIAFDALLYRQKDEFLNKELEPYVNRLICEKLEKSIRRNCSNCKNLLHIFVNRNQPKEPNIEHVFECKTAKEYNVYNNRCRNHEFNDDIFRLTGKR